VLSDVAVMRHVQQVRIRRRGLLRWHRRRYGLRRWALRLRHVRVVGREIIDFLADQVIDDNNVPGVYLSNVAGLHLAK